MGYFKEQKIEQMSHELEVDPFDFLRKQAARAERAAALRSWWQEEKEDLRRREVKEVDLPISASA